MRKSHETEASLEEIQRKLTRMVRFIELDGDEKVQEILDKTEEEYHFKKGLIIQEGRIKIGQEYDKKMALLKIQAQTELGVITTNYRKEILFSKKLMMDNIFEQINLRLSSDLQCVNKRWIVLQLLIMEGLFKILEPEIRIKCREIDANIIAKHLPELEVKYEKATSSKTKLTILPVYLPNDILPGIILSTNNDRVFLENTLNRRTEQIYEFVAPILNSIFYGSKTFSTSTKK